MKRSLLLLTLVASMFTPGCGLIKSLGKGDRSAVLGASAMRRSNRLSAELEKRRNGGADLSGSTVGDGFETDADGMVTDLTMDDLMLDLQIEAVGPGEVEAVAVGDVEPFEMAQAISLDDALVPEDGLMEVPGVPLVDDAGPGLLRLPEGGAAAQEYCGLCHSNPDASVLDWATWRDGVLPMMSPGGSRHTPLAEEGAIPWEASGGDPLFAARLHAPRIPVEHWHAIVDHVRNQAPEELEPVEPERPIAAVMPAHFSVEVPGAAMTVRPSTTAVQIDEDLRQVLIGSTDPDLLHIYDAKLRALSSSPVTSPPTWLEPFEDEKGNRHLSVTMAGVLDPNDLQAGTMVVAGLDGNRTGYQNPLRHLDRLRRPVHAERADLNGDGRMDFVISQFGDTVGKLTWFEAVANGRFRERLLIPRPGAIRTLTRDYDGDGDADVLALMTQAREGLYLLTNEGEGRFSETPLISFPPVYGASSFEMADLNGDGLDDVVLTCGDNADHSMIFKPYHGVYIYLRQADGTYEEAYFYPINGAFQALARDFDLDGDPDLVTTAFFPDYTDRPEESFVYFENRGSAGRFDFYPSTFAGALQGRWLSIDAGDIDGDGDADIVLGNFLYRLMGPGQVPKALRQLWARPGPRFIVLRNTTRR